MTMQRRAFAQGAMATGAAAIAVGAGVLTPHAALAAYPRAAFRSRDINDILSDVDIIDSADIVITAAAATESLADAAAMVPTNTGGNQAMRSRCAGRTTKAVPTQLWRR